MKSAIKIKRNDKCPCGSGQKYKKCCLHRKDDLNFLSENSDFTFEKYKTKIKKESHIKLCIAKDIGCCSGKIIHSHTFQKNGIIQKISENGYVVMPVPKDGKTKNFGCFYGIKKATTFTGFCSHHDKAIFQPIEDKDFTKSKLQLFLFTYRCFAYHYHSKLKSFKSTQNMFKLKPSLIQEDWFMLSLKEWEASIQDFERDYHFFNEALNDNNYNCLINLVWEFNEKIKFAFSAFEAPIRDFQGNIIQDYLTIPNQAKHIYYTVFPGEYKSYCIISVFKQDINVFKSYLSRLDSLSEKIKKNYINSIAIDLTENLIINPGLWNNLSQIEKDIIASRFYEKSDMHPLIGSTRNRFADPGYNLFA